MGRILSSCRAAPASEYRSTKAGNRCLRCERPPAAAPRISFGRINFAMLKVSFFCLESPLNKLAQNPKRNHDHGMRIQNRFSRLRGSSVRCASVVLTFAFCASAFAADPSKNVVLPAHPQRVMKTARKMCYRFTTTSAIPMPCDRVSAIPTTASPMTIYRNPAAK